MVSPIQMNPVDSITGISWDKYFEENGRSAKAQELRLE